MAVNTWHKIMTTRIIKKYKNRRLYDTERNRYITLDEVKQLVCDSISFKVIEADTGKDLTQLTLLQIITEQETTEHPIFTNEVLCSFIKSYNEQTQSVFRHYLENSMRVFSQQNDLFLQQLENMQKILGPFSGAKFDENDKKSQK